MNAVAVLHDRFLGYTETFLYHPLTRLRRWEPVVFAHRAENLDRFPWPDLHLPGRLPRPALLGQAVRLARQAYVPSWTDVMRARGVSVLHAQFGPVGLMALGFKLRLKLPLVTSLYGFDVGILERPDAKENRASWPVYVRAHRALWRLGDRFLVLSEAMKEDVVRLGCPAEKIRVHPNGVDLSRFRPVDRSGRGGPMVVAMCGWEVEKKGFEYGFRAVRRALDRGADLRVRWLGVHGPLRPPLLALVGELGLADRVEVLDERAEPRALMESADVILCPSVTDRRGNKEGVPTVLVEAAACGVPAVASRHAGIPSVVEDGVTGILCAERDVDGLAAGLLRLAADPSFRRELGARARRKVERELDATLLAARLEEHYDELRAASRGRRG